MSQRRINHRLTAKPIIIDMIVNSCEITKILYDFGDWSGYPGRGCGGDLDTSAELEIRIISQYFIVRWSIFYGQLGMEKQQVRTNNSDWVVGIVDDEEIRGAGLDDIGGVDGHNRLDNFSQLKYYLCDMQVSKRKVSAVLEKQITGMWYQLIADTKTREDAQIIFGDVLSETELEAVSKRIAIAYWLAKGRSYENIKDNVKVSSATIASVQQEMKREGWKMAMEKIMAEEWATRWEEKIKQRIPLWRKSLSGNHQQDRP